jgi:hypothetical protein
MSTNLKDLQKMSHRVNVDKTEVANTFLIGLKAALAKRGYRADLCLSTDAKSTASRFTASVAYNIELGYPTETDVVTLVAATYPTHDIDWTLAEVNAELGLVRLSLQPSVEVVPVASIKDIPSEFAPIGTGLYKRAVDSTVNEIWTLKRSEDGLALYRNQNDIEVVADDDELKAGDVTNTPYGPGRVVRFDDQGNALVQVGNKKHFVAAKELTPYSTEKEQKKLKDYYAEMFGDESFAADLVRTDTEIVKDMFGRSKK